MCLGAPLRKSVMGRSEPDPLSPEHAELPRAPSYSGTGVLPPRGAPVTHSPEDDPGSAELG